MCTDSGVGRYSGIRVRLIQLAVDSQGESLLGAHFGS
jgi:hypothetical protein